MEDGDDDGGGEDEPLLQRARKGVATLQARRMDGRPTCFRELPWIVALMMLQVCILRAESALQFPYLRSLQHCDAPAESFDRGAWSGSDFCKDRAMVSRQAQAEAGYVLGCGMVAHTISLPFLGWLADRFGRKPVIILNFAGLLAEAAINTAVQSVPALFFSVALQMATNGLMPALLAMIADSTHPDDRLGAYLICMLAAVPAYTLVYITITTFVLAEHLHSYKATWHAIAVFAVLGLLVALVCPETLHRSTPAQLHPPSGAVDDEGEGDDVEAREGWSAPSASAAGAKAEGADGGGAGLAGLELPEQEETDLLSRSQRGRRAREWLYSEPEPEPPAWQRLAQWSVDACSCCAGGRGGADGGHDGCSSCCCCDCGRSLCAPCAMRPLRFVMMVEVPLLLGLSAFSVLDGYALISYQWEQETMYYVRLATMPAGGVAVLASTWLMRVIGPLRTMQLAVALPFASLLLMCFAQWHTHLLFGSLVLAGGAGLAVLPVLRLLATQVAPDKQAAGTATILAVAHGSRAVGLSLHAFVFDEAAARGVLYAPFAFGALALAFALFIALVIPPPDHAWRLGTLGRSAGAAREREIAAALAHRVE